MSGTRHHSALESYWGLDYPSDLQIGCRLFLLLSFDFLHTSMKFHPITILMERVIAFGPINKLRQCHWTLAKSSPYPNGLQMTPNLVMDMEHELQALRVQLAEKCKYSIQLQKELARKMGEETVSQLYELDGMEALGSFLQIQPCSLSASELSECSIQWYRLACEGGKQEPISGATKPVYAPEPFDVGRILQAEITYGDQTTSVTTAGPIDPAAGLGNYVEALVRRHDIEFNVVVIQMNGTDHASETIHVLHIGRMRMKLCKGKTGVAKEYYSISMQLCGIRGGGNAAAQAAFWQVKTGLSFVLAFETERERNAAIMLARRFAYDCNIMLSGPDDRAAAGS
ncbi:Stomatal closure-related actin-binding protein 1 [Capsicum chinense]|nr:Stomatal closure-related actin-binding protein 1 [Capsicum chinense]